MLSIDTKLFPTVCKDVKIFLHVWTATIKIQRVRVAPHFSSMNGWRNASLSGPLFDLLRDRNNVQERHLAQSHQASTTAKHCLHHMAWAETSPRSVSTSYVFTHGWMLWIADVAIDAKNARFQRLSSCKMTPNEVVKQLLLVGFHEVGTTRQWKSASSIISGRQYANNGSETTRNYAK